MTHTAETKRKSGAIFDMDGLMFDTERIYQTCWNELADEMGIQLSDQFAHEIGGTSGDLLYAVIRKHYRTKEPEKLFHRCLSKVEERLTEQVPVKPGLFAILDYFRSEGVKLAVASSSNRYVIRSNVHIAGVEDYFDVLVSGSELKHGKPEPDIFLLAAQELRLDPGDCYVFEDSINGVLAGLSAGCRTVMVPDCTAPNEVILKSDAAVCSSLNEALEQIKGGQL